MANHPQVVIRDMTEHLLAPVDNFDPWARAVAETIVAMETPETTTVHLIHVFDEAERQSTTEHLEVDDETAPDKLAARKSSVKAAREVLEDAGFKNVVHGAQSDEPGRTILSRIEPLNVDRVYIYSRKRSPVGKAIFGSNIQDLLFNATVPVVVLPSDAAPARSVEDTTTLTNAED